MDLTKLIVHQAAKDDRRVGVGGTDARIIAAGLGWHQLYLEKTGQVERVDLSNEWKPRLGLETEALHAWWHARTTNCQLSDPWDGQPVTRIGLPSHYYVTFDRIGESFGEPSFSLEMKHTNERNNLRDAATYYMGQLQWQMMISGDDQKRFSIIRGNSEPEWGWVARDDSFISSLIAQVDAFWWHVENREAPEADPVKAVGNAAALNAAAKTIPINGFKPYDMEGNNEWADAAWPFIRDKVASETLKENEKRIRSLIPADASDVTGHGLSFKRDARGAYRVTINEEEAAAWRAVLDAKKGS